MCRSNWTSILSSTTTLPDIPRSGRWLAGRGRSHTHFAPTYASWLSQVERFFSSRNAMLSRSD